MLDFEFYSPEEEIALPFYGEYGVRVFVKRDDLIHPYISGNKWRKLKYPLQQAKEEEKSLLVTFGGAWSNHLLATACAGAKFGFRTYGFVRGEAIDNPVLTLCQLFGMELHFVDRESYRDKKGLFETYFASSEESYFIEEGGYGPLAAQGCSEITNELRRTYDHCFCACGTGTTLAGLAHGIANQQRATTLHGVPILKGGNFIRDEIAKLGVLNAVDICLHLDYHFGGYAKTKPELIEFIKTFTSQTSILIEPTYTGKLFYAVHDLIAQRQIAPGSTVLVVHSGGLTGLLGMLDKF
ncbi:1-aminocyclopropane-1-carboxylate deaminase/D-cysteine desulfhydrase [Sphingobacterium sp. SGR-19]|uniref:1-aminocyclopropane-1-carboxylate deaminase/D-cysteine desulfhydrase n=1 Tax=Sphingobacterium sp. SGR-19 TaxID=2710886 RepID=UPI0013E9C895|nr:pyridoxal-phosphate dependent enzyme [Sphingobacterium sp. SGR-19]NGM66778.1 pyridoxal-phosphate dependent enzyme [Sphingobacterium sp. SGR-19]